jgi:hypothetical protein
MRNVTIITIIVFLIISSINVFALKVISPYPIEGNNYYYGNFSLTCSETNYFSNPLGYFNISTLPVSNYNDAWINNTIDNKITIANTSIRDYVLWVNSTNGVGTGIISGGNDTLIKANECLDVVCETFVEVNQYG